MAAASGVARDAAADWAWYGRACNRRRQVVADAIQKFFGDDLSGRRVLDWGSALGGVALLIDESLPVEVTAADVDKHALAWLSAASSSVKTVQLEPGAPLPFSDDAFDIIYGISVFTHIPPELQGFYLEELCRVVAPGGLVLLTVKGYKAVDAAKAEGRVASRHPYSREQLDKDGIIYASYPDRVLARMDFANKADYGITYHSPQYVKETFGRWFDITWDEENMIGKQDVLILRPKK